MHWKCPVCGFADNELDTLRCTCGYVQDERKLPATPEEKRLSKMEEYVVDARQRAQRRKSPWNLLLIPLSLGGWGGSAYLLYLLMWRVHILFYPEHASRYSEFLSKGLSFSGILLLIGVLCAAVPFGLLFANGIAWCVPPARRAFASEAQGVKGTSFTEAMRGLWGLGKFLVPICLFLSSIGAITLKNLN